MGEGDFGFRVEHYADAVAKLDALMIPVQKLIAQRLFAYLTTYTPFSDVAKLGRRQPSGAATRA